MVRRPHIGRRLRVPCRFGGPCMCQCVEGGALHDPQTYILSRVVTYLSGSAHAHAVMPDRFSFRHKVKDYSLSGAYRHMIAVPTNFSHQVVSYTDEKVSLIRSDAEVLQGMPCRAFFSLFSSFLSSFFFTFGFVFGCVYCFAFPQHSGAGAHGVRSGAPPLYRSRSAGTLEGGWPVVRCQHP